MDSHMYLDNLQNAGKRQDLCEIMKHGLMPTCERWHCNCGSQDFRPEISEFKRNP